MSAPVVPAPVAVPFRTLCLRSARAVPLFAAAVAYAWLLHLGHLARCRTRRHLGDAGMTTAEYAVGTVVILGNQKP